MKKNNRKGFTIVELVIVIAVIAILAGVLVPTFASVVSKANNSAILQEVTAARTTILAEENGVLDSKCTYYFVYNDASDAKDESKWYTYDASKGKVVEATVATGGLKADGNDVIFAAESTQNVISIADGVTTPLPVKTNSDLGKNVVVLKVVPND